MLEGEKEGDVVAVPFFCLSLILVSLSLSLSVSDRSEDLRGKIRLSCGGRLDWEATGNVASPRFVFLRFWFATTAPPWSSLSARKQRSRPPPETYFGVQRVALYSNHLGLFFTFSKPVIQLKWQEAGISQSCMASVHHFCKRAGHFLHKEYFHNAPSSV